MVIRHSPRAPPSPRSDNDPEQARRTLFPGEGSRVGSPRMGSPRRQRSSNGNGGNDYKIRRTKYSRTVLAVAATLSAILSLLVTFLTWNSNTIMSNTQLHPGLPNSDATASLRSTPIHNNRVIQAIQKAPIGSLGPSGTNRTHLHYYDTLFFVALQFGADAKSIIEIGCASDPFIQYLDWTDQRTCVAPYFVEYGDFSNTNNDLASTKITAVTADFMEYQLPNNEKFDLLLCNQVLEHVPDPASFMKKLIESAKTSIISVPYYWEGCGECNHKTNFISMSTLTEWSAPYLPVFQGIVTEDGDGKFNERVIFVYETD